jgi:hypothetical protein
MGSNPQLMLLFLAYICFALLFADAPSFVLFSFYLL